MKKSLLIVLLQFFALNLFAQVAGITKLDIRPGAASSYPMYVTAYGGKVYCFATDGIKGTELRVTTGIGTPSLVYDIYPLSTSCLSSGFNKPTAELGGKLYFTADNGLSGYELFVYDGTNTPSIAQDIIIGADGSSPDDYAALNGDLYFRARDNLTGYELWKYNTSTTNCTRLTDLCPGIDSSLWGGIIAFNNKIVFAADSGKGNTELFEYDPATDNITLIADIYPGSLPSAPMHFTVINNKLYFSANSGNYGRELYSYDGINPPVRLTDVAGGNTSAIPAINEPMIASFAGKVYFTAKDTASGNYNIYSIDGSNNTVLATTPNGAAGNSLPSWLTPYAGRLFFTAYNDTTGFELWMLDSSNNVSLAFELCTGTNGSDPEQLLSTGSDLYFSANDCLGIGTELFRYNYKSVSIPQLPLIESVILFPNPAKNIATLRMQLTTAQNLNLRITDMAGRTVYTTGLQSYTAGQKDVPIMVSQLPKGNYVYTLHNEAGLPLHKGKLAVE